MIELAESDSAINCMVIVALTEKWGQFILKALRQSAGWNVRSI